MTGQFGNKNKAWSARFSEPVSDLVKRYTASVDFDQRLAEVDIRGSLAHAAMLAATGILSESDLASIQRGFTTIREEIAAGRFEWSLDLEDVHLNIEKRLTELVGDAGKRLHTARSRNDQVATDIRLWLRDATDEILTLLRALQEALLALAEQHADTIMPGFTHLQVAQPVTFGHHLLAYVEMLSRDAGRLADTRRRLERDIHDGPQQRLVRLRMDLARAHRQAEKDPAAASAIIQGAMEQTQQTLDELRQLSRGIAPPVLIDRGLAAAITEAATRSSVPVTVSTELPDLPDHVSQAAYFVVSEALANLNKHSGATVAGVEARVVDGSLQVRISDNGIGGASTAKGHGLAGLGGRCLRRGGGGLGAPVGLADEAREGGRGGGLIGRVGRHLF